MNTDRLLALGLVQLWQVSLAIVVIGPIACLAFRRRPHWAYAMWLLLLVKAITPPLWSSPTGIFSWLSVERVAQPVAAAPALPRSESAPALSPPMFAAPPPAMPDFSMPAKLAPVASRPAGVAISISAILLAVWAIGAGGLVSLVVILSLAMLRRLRRDARQPGPELAKRFADLQAALGAGRRVRLVVSSGGFGPALVGLVRPQIVLPAVIVDQKPTNELAPILAHELVHFRRGDHWIAHVQLLAQALWWFHPLVWWMNRQLGRAREMGCDEEVLAALGCPPADYAQTLLDVVRLRRAESELRAIPLALSMQSAEFAAARLTHIMSGSLGFHRRTPRAAWVAAALGALLVLPGAALVAQNPPAQDDKPAQSGDEQPADAALLRTVVDGGTGKPLSGLHLTIEHIIRPDGDAKVVATTKQITDKEGRYEIKIPAAELAERTLTLWPTIDEPGYAPLPPVEFVAESLQGSHQARQFRQHGGSSPFDPDAGYPGADIDRAYPGAEVTGTVVDPQGKPVADLPVYVSSLRDLKPKQSEEDAKQALKPGTAMITSFQVPLRTVVRTDAQGRFRFNAVRQGTAEFWVEPAGYAALSRSIDRQRGDIGTTVLEPGVRVQGRVVDVEGQPVPEVWVRLGSDNNVPVGGTFDNTWRVAKTDRDGHFQLEPVQAGEFLASVSTTPARFSLSEGSLPAAFEEQEVTVPSGKAEMSIEIRAVPHHTIRAKFSDAAGKRFGGGKLSVLGRGPGTHFFRKTIEADGQGLAVVRLPRGFQSVHAGTQPELESIYRLGNAKDGLHNKTDVELGPLDDDVDDLEFVHYRIPTLWFDAVDPAGKPIGNASAKIAYLLPSGKVDPEPTQTVVYHVSAGQWSTQSLLPDQDFTLSVSAPGRKPATHKLKLAEGENKELKVVLEPAAPQPKGGAGQAAPPSRLVASTHNAADKEPVGETIVRTVVDGESGKPLAGAHITVEHMTSPAEGAKVIATTKHVTDNDGRYEIKLPASELEHPTLSLRFAVEQPGYAPSAPNSYVVHGFRDARGLPMPHDDRIYPGVEVTGTIEDATGKRLAGLAINFSSWQLPSEEQTRRAGEEAEASGATDTIGTITSTGARPITSEGVAHTDGEGRFRCMVLKDSTAWLWAEPTGYATLFRTIGEEHSLGEIVLASGVRVAGRVVDAEGRGVAGAWVRVDPLPDPAAGGNGNESRQWNMSDLTRRTAQTDSEGRFRTEPVNPGRFMVGVGATPARSPFWFSADLPAIFKLTIISLPADKPETTIELRATPHYTIRARFVDPAGKPLAGGKLRAFGSGPPPATFAASIESDRRGLAEIRVPRDLTSVDIGPYQPDAENIYRLRRGREGPPHIDSVVSLAELTGDIDDLTFIRHRPAALSIAVVDPAGKPIAEPAISLEYLTDEGQIDPEQATYEPFPPQDGRSRVIALLPDQPLRLTVEASGRQAASEKLKLAEGETKELKVVLQPAGKKP